MSTDGVLLSRLLADTPGIAHGFESRDGDLEAALGMPALRLRQVHGAAPVQVGAGGDRSRLRAEDVADRPAGDALVTADPDALVTVATADCVPVLVADPEAPAVAAIHAGWRGVALGIVPSTLAVMAREHGARPERCKAAIGPRVGADHYQVGDDVRTSFLAAGLPEAIFRTAEPGEAGDRAWWCDLGAAVRHQLVACGLPEGSVDTLDACTVRDAERFWSYRRQGERAGRMTSGIRLLARD